MLKIRSDMLKIKRSGKIIKLEKNSRENFPGIPRIFGIPGISQNSRKIFLKFPVFREVENPGKRESLYTNLT